MVRSNDMISVITRSYLAFVVSDGGRSFKRLRLDRRDRKSVFYQERELGSGITGCGSLSPN